MSRPTLPPAEAPGACLCGRVRYRATTARARAIVCHCRDCQRQSGSAFSVLLAMPATDLAIDGALSTFDSTAASGRVVSRRFCAHCGTPVLSVSPGRPGVVALKAGTLDDPAWLVPRLHLWCASAQPWVPLPADVPCHPEQPA